MEVSGSSKDFSVFSMLTQLGLLLARTILGNLDMILKVFLKERQKYQNSMII